MAQFRRFGRRMPVASTLAISHDLRTLWADEKERQYCAEADGLPSTASWEDIIDSPPHPCCCAEAIRRCRYTRVRQ
jgi:ABC-type antimicrobial peptide transport system ATPase subunit